MEQLRSALHQHEALPAKTDSGEQPSLNGDGLFGEIAELVLDYDTLAVAIEHADINRLVRQRAGGRNRNRRGQTQPTNRTCQTNSRDHSCHPLPNSYRIELNLSEYL